VEKKKKGKRFRATSRCGKMRRTWVGKSHYWIECLLSEYEKTMEMEKRRPYKERNAAFKAQSRGFGGGRRLVE